MTDTIVQQAHQRTPPEDAARRKPVRLWPGVAAAVLLLVVRFAVPAVFPEAGIVGLLGAVGAGLAIVVWWVFLSRAPWSERVGAVFLMVVVGIGARFIIHDSIRGGMMGMMLPITLAIPGLSLALVAWAVATRRLAPGARRAALVALMLLTSGSFALLRTEGVMGEGVPQFTWRWTPTAEERLLAGGATEPAAAAPAAAPAASPERSAIETGVARADPSGAPGAPAIGRTAPPSMSNDASATLPAPRAAAAKGAAWPGFRGADRDSATRGVRIETDWSKSPPVALWRRPIGPGWSSFAVEGDLAYTQEQRGEDEVVACYRVTTGQPVWMHKDPVRFYESNAGAGPRATPAVANGRVYALGATGILNALEAGTGTLVWSRNAAKETEVEIPGWGISGSPLPVGDLVVVAASGALVAYDQATGHQRWSIPSSGGSYSSPHLIDLGGTPHILLMTGAGLTSVAPADGSVLWKHPWPGSPIVQPAMTPDGDVLLTTADMSGGVGIRRLSVRREAAAWSAEERWTSRGLKPYFNDFVVHGGHAFGFDGSILAAIDLADGTRKWKGGRYGHGQLLLLADQDLLLVLSEEGELALVRAIPDQFTEVARFKAIEGKTWNHPALIGDILLVRNGEEMAAFRLIRQSTVTH